MTGCLKRGDRTYYIYDTDIFIVSYPRSGNTWLRYLIANLIHPDKKIDFDLVNNTVIDFYQKEEMLLKYTPGRFIKSHEAYTETYPKVVYVYRDGRDVAGSYFRFYQDNFQYRQSFAVFIEEMLRGRLAFGSWQDHIESWLFREKTRPFFPIQYEDLLINTESVVKRLCDFLHIDVSQSILKRAIAGSSTRSQSTMYAKFQKLGDREFPEIVNTQFKWIDNFNKDLQDYFFSKAGTVMDKLGYKPYPFD